MRSRSLLLTLTATAALAVPSTASAQLPCVEAGPVTAGECTPAPAPAPPAHVAGGCENGALTPSRDNVAQIRAATLCLVNKERTKRGLRKLRNNKSLRNVATKYSRLMVRKGFFDHVSPSGSTLVQRIRRSSYLKKGGSWALAENIAWGSGEYATPAETVEGWMKSSGHRHNILDAGFKEIGVGVAIGAPVKVGAAQSAATYTTNFGRRS